MRPSSASSLIRSDSFSFFFSSRRRHTSCSRDWSSDVCSSDLRRLKAGLRTYGLKVIDAYEHTTAKVSHCRTAQAVRTTQARRIGEVKMEMSQYSGGRSEERRVGKE